MQPREDQHRHTHPDQDCPQQQPDASDPGIHTNASDPVIHTNASKSIQPGTSKSIHPDASKSIHPGTSKSMHPDASDRDIHPNASDRGIQPDASKSIQPGTSKSIHPDASDPGIHTNASKSIVRPDRQQPLSDPSATPPLEVRVENDLVRSTIWHIDGIRLGHAVYQTRDEGPPQPATRPAGPSPDVVRLHFGLKGNYSFTYRQLDRSFDLIGGHHNLMYSREFNIEVQPHSPQLEIFGVQFPRELFIQFTRNASDALQRFAESIIDGKSVLFSEHWGAIDPGIEQVIRQITQSPYGGDLQRLFLLSKSIELLVLSADACAAVPADSYIRTRTDKEKIIAVRDLVNGRIEDPPNLSEIARTVGLNEYKLKRGFKETFHTTVFGYLAEQRLQMALQYLRDTDLTAAEISAQLGYASPQHFNNTFKKKFGKPPASVRKNP